MHIYTVPALLVLLSAICDLCTPIKVPVAWGSDSAVNNEPNEQVETVPQNVQTLHQSQPIPVEYFQYTAQKPQFAADIAAFHGVQNPHEHYKAYPIKPFTGASKPLLGIHQMLNEDKAIYQPFQRYIQKTEETKKQVQPTSTGYEIFHPYKAEEPALQAIYQDPVLSKIRNDLRDTKQRLQNYEEEAGKPNISEDEYLEGHKKTDGKLFPQKNIPARYETHRPERRPVYYSLPPKDSYRDQVLNQRFKHPWNQQNARIRPVHYKPLKNHIHNLRQHHAMKYDDEHNEYPQVIRNEDIAEPLEGYDIYEKGRQKYTQLRDNVDESLNKVVQENRPATYQKLELQNNEPNPRDEEDEFIPVKNYAQVRKSETYKHVPRKAAFDDAETLEEIINAPRLREAVKSTKAQTVYSEEGYEDSAYDHAGEQKHASDHEGHGGFLKENEKSGGLYKIPTVLGSYQDGAGSEYRDKIVDGKKWDDDRKEDDESEDSEEYSEQERDETVGAHIYDKKGPNDGQNRNKREHEQDVEETNIDEIVNEEDGTDDNSNDKASDRSSVSSDDSDTESSVQMETKAEEHDVDKREANFKVPDINIDSTYLTESEILKLAKQKILPIMDDMKSKYPYYFKKLKSINKNSPLRYAENMKFIPKKSDGGTEFYDSRSNFECPEVDDDVDPIPEKLKSGENPEESDDEEEDDESNSKEEKKIDTKNKQRLRGLGDKIDCFKAKFFGENPLDSPFFKEEIISNPDPITAPKLPIYDQLKHTKKQNILETKPNDVLDTAASLRKSAQSDIFALIGKLRNDRNQLEESLKTSGGELQKGLLTPQEALTTNNSLQSDIFANIQSNINNDSQLLRTAINKPIILNDDLSNKTYSFFTNKEDITNLPQRRVKRAAFVYEPYKIIKDSQVQDSKKTTTSSNISPLIRQLQSSRVVDRVSRSNRPAKPTASLTYVDIGKKDRAASSPNPAIVDVSVDQRRGEPRYEIRPRNHKSEYTPVVNAKAMSVEDYKSRAGTLESTTEKNDSSRSVQRRQRIRPTTAAARSSKMDIQNTAASNTVKQTVTTTTPVSVSKEIDRIEEDSDDESDESDESDEDDDEDEYPSSSEFMNTPTTTTTTTTPKPSFKRRRPTTTTTTTTEKPQQQKQDAPEKLRLVTRFQNYKLNEAPEEPAKIETATPPSMKTIDDYTVPKYREKKKKTSKSTLVTDTKKYGDDDDEGDKEDDMREKELDAMIGLKQDMDDYMPVYERSKEFDRARLRHDADESDDMLAGYDEDDDDEDDDDSDEDDDDDSDEHIDDDEEEEDDDRNTQVNKKTEQDDRERFKKSDEGEEPNRKETVTTPVPTKLTLVKTTDAPIPTVASFERTSKPDHIKPVITRKKVEIHKESPVNKSSPHVTQFKQDIKEEEIIKEMPTPFKRKPQKKVEPLELYKDDKLAEDVNKLGDVEIFSEGIDLEKGPKHGGNYRKATKEDLRVLPPLPKENHQKPPKDAETSQTENKKHIELDQYSPRQLHGGNLKSINEVNKRRGNSGRSAKLIELSDTPIRTMHGGNLKFDTRRRGGRRNEKLIELDSDHDDEHNSRDDDNDRTSPHNSRTDRLHGGNYRSGKLVAAKEKKDEAVKVANPSREARRNAAVLLNSFVQAVPVLTTTPGYILDPSKRMYYYVEA